MDIFWIIVVLAAIAALVMAVVWVAVNSWWALGQAIALGLFVVLALLFLREERNIGNPFNDPSVRERVEMIVDDLDDNADRDDVEDALREEGVSEREASRLARAIVEAKERGASNQDILDALEDLDEEDFVSVRKELDKVAPATPSPTATPPAAASTPSPIAASGDSLPNGNAPSYKEASFRDNRQFVKCDSTFADQTAWLLCEPGVLLDNTATFTRGQTRSIYSMDCPEGGFAYASFAQGRFHLARAGFTVDFPNMGAGTNRLVVTRCPISDGKRDTDLNDTVEIGNFVVGHTIWSEIPPNHPDGSAFVSKGWFGQQLVTSFHTGGSNCGSDGCSTIYVTLIDVNSQLVETFKVTDITFQKGPSGYNDYVNGTWQRTESNSNLASAKP